MFRTLNIYRFLIERGMEPEMLRMEAFGRHHPRYSDLTAEGRRSNRRVDIILDKRNVEWMDKLGPERKEEQAKNFIYKDFVFELEQNNTGKEAP